MKTIVTVTGIRPDFIRMSEIFKKLDENFNHTLIHTGQHFDDNLSEVFFKGLEIRKPNMNLNIGGPGKPHYQQTAELSSILTKLIKTMAHQPDLIVFLGDSNSVAASVALKKEGYKIAHIEAGMRSGDKRMLEEINRTVCDHCSDYHFVYHEDYKNNLIAENLPEENIFVVGNTIVEVFNKWFTPMRFPQTWKNHIIVDIHRPENFKYKDRLKQILFFANQFANIYDIPVYMLNFERTMKAINDFNLDLKRIEKHSLMGYAQYLQFQNQAELIFSDSGTAQEEPSLMQVPVIVPRDFTERPQSIANHCSHMLDLNIEKVLSETNKMYDWLDTRPEMNSNWLGQGNTSDLIMEKLKKIL
jgi:UDP-N-acetylglucosamine 2-epimerase (non-hydrolysing)